MALRTKRKKRRDRYLSLVQQFPLCPIRTDEELELAIGMIDTLIDRQRLESGEKDYLDLLSELVERYETVNHPIPQLPDSELLQYLIATKGVSQAETARATGIAESTISEVLGGKRCLSRTHIVKLARYFGVQPGAFMLDA